MGVGQPGVEGEHGHLDGEGEEETQEQKSRDLRTIVGINARRGVVERLQGEGVRTSHMLMMKVEKQDTEQHQYGAGKSVKEEFYGGVELAGASPDADQQVHGNKHGFPEN